MFRRYQATIIDIYLAPHGILRYTEYSKPCGSEVQAMDKKQDTFPNEALAEINVKLEQILQNQEQLFDLLGQIGSALVTFSKMNKVVHQDEIKNERHRDILARYGEVCQQKVAAEILDVTPKTISRWIEEGRLKVIGSKVDVRSICAYLDSGISKGQSVKRKKRSSQKTWQEASKANLKDPILIDTPDLSDAGVEKMSEFERSARGIKRRR